MVCRLFLIVLLLSLLRISSASADIVNHCHSDRHARATIPLVKFITSEARIDKRAQIMANRHIEIDPELSPHRAELVQKWKKAMSSNTIKAHLISTMCKYFSEGDLMLMQEGTPASKTADFQRKAEMVDEEVTNIIKQDLQKIVYE